MSVWSPQRPALSLSSGAWASKEARGFFPSPNMPQTQWLSHLPIPLSPPTSNSLEKITKELMRREMWLEREPNGWAEARGEAWNASPFQL